jgi:hypothetical protein
MNQSPKIQSARLIFMRNLHFTNNLLLSSYGYEGDPLSPPEGEASQGEHPLDPLRFPGFFPALLKPFPIILYIALIGLMNNVSEF